MTQDRAQYFQFAPSLDLILNEPPWSPAVSTALQLPRHTMEWEAANKAVGHARVMPFFILMAPYWFTPAWLSHVFLQPGESQGLVNLYACFQTQFRSKKTP